MLNIIRNDYELNKLFLEIAREAILLDRAGDTHCQFAQRDSVEREQAVLVKQHLRIPAGVDVNSPIGLFLFTAHQQVQWSEIARHYWVIVREDLRRERKSATVSSAQ